VSSRVGRVVSRASCGPRERSRGARALGRASTLALAQGALALVAAQGACGGGAGASASGSARGAASAPAPRASVLVGASASAQAAGPRDDDPVVLEAASLEPEALRALVEARTAEELVSVVRRRGPGRPIALAALPHARDAELALEPLTTLAGSDPDKTALLEAVRAIASSLARATEPLDLDGRRRAHAALEALSRDRTLDAEARALAHAAARELAARGSGAPSEPPAELL
jgi:hypothetical protein